MSAVSYAHAVAGGVWVATNDEAPRLVVGSWQPAATVRLLGTARNAPLILDLRCRGFPLEIAAARAVCLAAEELNDPVMVLVRARQCLLSPSLGGWHRYVDAVDGPAYLLAAARVDRLPIALTHPAWFDLNFVGGLDTTAAAELLAIIIDPRFFVSLRRPDRLSPLLAYMGVSARAYDALERGCMTGHSGRLKILLAAMRLAHTPKAALLDADGYPGYFPHRIAASAFGWRGVLRAAKVFLVYLIRTWQERIAVLTFSTQTEPLFEPALLFTDEEARGYAAYCRKRPRD